MAITPRASLIPADARCLVMKTGIPARVWQWEDLVDDDDVNWPLQPALPFDGDADEIIETATGDIPPLVRTTASAIARGIAEVLAGQRSAVQLSRWLDDAPLRVVAAAARGYRRHPPRPASIRLQLTPTGSVEVTVRLLTHRGSSAAAYRLELRHQQWRCTAVAIGP